MANKQVVHHHQGIILINLSPGEGDGASFGQSEEVEEEKEGEEKEGEEKEEEEKEGEESISESKFSVAAGSAFPCPGE